MSNLYGEKALAIVSGGLDSVTLAYWLRDMKAELSILSFNYGQRHVKELEFARLAAERLEAPFDIIDLQSVGALLGGNALTDNAVPVPAGHYAAPVMRQTVVQNRNAIMLAIAFGIAASRGLSMVAIGAHGGDHFIYPDCRPVFLAAFDLMEQLSLGEWAKVRLLSPFRELTKAQVVVSGAIVAVPFADTWSCYAGQEKHCGVCGTCVERKEAFRDANLDDPTEYEA